MGIRHFPECLAPRLRYDHIADLHVLIQDKDDRSPSTAVFELRSCPNFKGTSTPSRRMILSGTAVEAPPEGVAEVAAGRILGEEDWAGAAGEVSAGAAG